MEGRILVVSLKECQICGRMEAEKPANNQWVLARVWLENGQRSDLGYNHMSCCEKGPEKISTFSDRIMYNALSQLYLLAGQVS